MTRSGELHNLILIHIIDVCSVLDNKNPAPAENESPLFSMMKQEPISGVVSTGHLSGYRGCSASDGGLMSPTTSTAMMMSMPEKNYLVDDRGLLNGTVFSGAVPGAVHHPQMTRVNGLRVNYANRGGTIRSYHCRLCRKVDNAIYRVGQKTAHGFRRNNFVYSQSIFIIFGTYTL